MADDPIDDSPAARPGSALRVGFGLPPGPAAAMTERPSQPVVPGSVVPGSGGTLPDAPLPDPPFPDDANSGEDMRAASAPLSAPPARALEVPAASNEATLDVAAIRARTGLSQAAFAARYRFSKRTLQEWEQGRKRPTGAARSLLAVIKRHPKKVAKALAREAEALGHEGATDDDGRD